MNTYAGLVEYEADSDSSKRNLNVILQTFLLPYILQYFTNIEIKVKTGAARSSSSLTTFFCPLILPQRGFLRDNALSNLSVVVFAPTRGNFLRHVRVDFTSCSRSKLSVATRSRRYYNFIHSPDSSASHGRNNEISTRETGESLLLAAQTEKPAIARNVCYVYVTFVNVF